MRIIENIKSVILTMLILSSLVLTGSLWFDNYQGLSLAISKVPDFFSDKLSKEEYSKFYEEIIVPYKVTVINPDENKWISYNTDKMHLDAWNILKSRLSSINPETEIITGKVKEWDELINRKSIIYEFGGPIEEDILALAIPNLLKESGAFNNIEKISITKSLEGNTIYILQNGLEGKSLYKVLLKGNDEEIKTFMQSCENIMADVKYLDLENIGVTKFYNNKSIVAGKNVLFPISNRQNKRDKVSKLNVKKHFNSEDEYLMARFVTEIFNNTDFAKFITNDKGKIYINDDKSSIKMDDDGIVEYINNGKIVEDDDVSVSKKFNTALDFIKNMKIFDNFFLISATKEDEVYTFRFSVAFDGIVVGFNEPIIEENKYAILEVKVENSDIRYFKGKLVDLELTNEKDYVSKITHNIFDVLLKDVPENSKLTISKLGLIYDISVVGNSYPAWSTEYYLTKDDVKNRMISVADR